MTEFGIIITQDGGDIAGPLYINDEQAISAGIDISRYRSAGDMLKEVYDTNDNGIVDAAESLTGTVEITQVNGLETELSGLETELSEQAAGLAAHVADMDNPHNVTIAQTGAATAILGSASGDVATMEDAAALPALSAVAMMGPVQEGEGDPYPPGGGKNLLPNTATSQTINGVTFTVNEDGSVTANGTASAQIEFIFVDYKSHRLENGEYILSGCPTGGSGNTYRLKLYDAADPNSGNNDTGDGVVVKFVGEDSTWNSAIIIANGYTSDNLTFYPMIRLASDTDATYQPYSNIRPITGHEGCEMTVTGAEGEGTAYSATFPQTVYGGSYDFVTGRLTVDRVVVTLDGTETWSQTVLYNQPGMYRYRVDNITPSIKTPKDNLTKADVISSHYQVITAQDGYVTTTALTGVSIQSDIPTVIQIRDERYKTSTLDEWKAYLAAQYAAGTPVQVCYELASPLTYDLTPQQVDMLFGVNNVVSDTGESRVAYVADTKLYIDGKFAELAAAIVNNA